MKSLSILIVVCISFLNASAQPDSLAKKPASTIIFSSESNLELTGTDIIDERIDTLSKPELRIGGYVSTYYAYYDDNKEANGFVQFPTLAPRNNQFSLNMALVSMAYKSNRLRSNITLQYGDVPESSWPANFKLIQEAHAGFRIMERLWLDAGFFKTHIGLESFQPRENITSSMSIPNFYDPYFLSGVKLTYLVTSKWSVQAACFNGYNEYVDNNKNKAFDFSTKYKVNDYFSLTYNFLTCDETPDPVKTKHQRYYQNMYATYSKNKLTVGADLNYGLQEHSLKSDTGKTASLYGAVLVVKYMALKKLGAYGRVEYFSDPNRVLTQSLDAGQYIKGTTLGIVVLPQKTSSLSFEWRILESDKLIFRQGNAMLNQRNEFIVCLDLWF
ncbi:MAG: outer membrane beta-barrel protein [Bacteroidia bacterium]